MQLLFYANTMFFIGNTRRVFELMISITQIDIALFSIIVEQLVSICTVYFLVSEKKFILSPQIPTQIQTTKYIRELEEVESKD